MMHPAMFLAPNTSTTPNGYSSPIKTTSNNPPKTDSSKKRKLIQLTSGQEKNDGELQTKLIIKAINNSFIQRMSGHYHELDPNDLLTVITEFAINESRKPKRQEDLTVRQWCVVEVDEKMLWDKQIGVLGGKPNIFSSICGHHITDQQRHQYNIVNNINLPNSIRPYCLILNMNGRQLHFQSHEEPENHFFINLDTVPVTIQEEGEPDMQTLLLSQQNIKKYLNQPISISVQNQDSTILIHMYFTAFTLPFPFKEVATQRQKNKYLICCRQSLYRILRKSIGESRGRQMKLCKVIKQSLNNQSRFYNDRYATEEQFVKYCESGDILLFKDAHTMAKVQRTITSSPYDHVAIVYKHQSLGICLFQSNSGLGVGLAPWRSLIRKHWFEGIDKIVWRKLQIDKRPPDFAQKIDEFVKGNLHKQFGISLPKLFKFKSKSYSKDSNKTYFCSELAAQLYRFLGLLDETKSSTQYWPKDFADGKGIEILNGALDPERELVFEHPLLKQCYPGYTQ